MRYVQEEEDKMRWQDAQVRSLHELQNRMYIYSSGEEAQPSQRVGQILVEVVLFH